MLSATRKTFSANEIQNQLRHEIYEPIWSMLHKIRIVMGKRDSQYKLAEFIEIDKDEKGRIYQFITNNFEITAEEVAFIYKNRWSIELMFKKLKQNFQLHYFYSETENGIKTQVWCTLIAHLLLKVLKVITKTKKAFSLPLQHW